MPIIVIKFPIDRLHQSLKRSRAQINDEGDGAVFQRQVDVVGRFARVQHEAVPLERLEGEGDLVAAALDGVQGQVVAEELRALEGGDVLLLSCGETEGRRYKKTCSALMSASLWDAGFDAPVASEHKRSRLRQRNVT